MKKIAIVTTTRAEYGLLLPVIRELRKSENAELKIDLIVSGTHLSKKYGMTINEIDERVDFKIPVSVNSNSEIDISANQAETLMLFTELFSRENYNAILLLGDRYETLAIAIAAGNTRTPIFHLCGGDTTEGAIDEWIRHSITKISYIHFVTNEDSKRRVIQLGEDPSRVFNYGSTSIDNIMTIADMSKEDALESVGISHCRYALCTYHPVTMGSDSVDYQINELIKAINEFPEIQFIVTKSNADQGGARINQLLDIAERDSSNLHVFASLGSRKYLSLMKNAEFVLGNSSSGIIEAPAFGVPTVNIGDRQRGRLQSDSILNCDNDYESIAKAVTVALSDEHKKKSLKTEKKYGEGKAAVQIASKTIEIVLQDRMDIKKKFFDL